MKRTPLARKTPMKRTSALVTRTPLKRCTALKPSSKRMRQSRSTSAPTAADVARFAAIRRIGCLACILNAQDSDIRLDYGFKRCPMPTEVHHLLSGGRRIGHHATLGMCRWHHQGDKWPDLSMGAAAVAKIYGPSLARSPGMFRAIYGSDTDLLHWQDNLIGNLKA